VLGGWEASFTPQRDWKTGNYSLRARLVDTGGAVSDWLPLPKEIAVVNNAPFVDGFTIPLNALNRTSTIEMTFNTGDIEDGPGGIRLEAHFKGPSGGYHDEFTAGEVQCDMTVKVNSTGSAYWRLTPLKGAECGNYSFRIRAVDSEGGTSEWQYFMDSLLVLNNLPFVLSLNATPSSVLRGDVVRVTVVGSDVEDYRDTLVCEVEYRPPGANGTPIKYLTPSGQGWEASFTAAAAWSTGECLVRARVMDMDQAWSDWSTTPVTVRNIPPTVTGILPGVTVVNAGKGVSPTVTATDTDTPLSALSSELEYRIGGDWKSAGAATPTAMGWSFPFTVPANTKG